MIHSESGVDSLLPPRVFLRLRAEVGVINPASSRLLAAGVRRAWVTGPCPLGPETLDIPLQCSSVGKPISLMYPSC